MDRKEALKWFRKSARQEYPAAYNALGCAYYWGQGVKRNYKKALECFKRAADKKDILAIRNLAIFYSNDDIMEHNIAESQQYYEKAFHLAQEQVNDKRAQWILGFCFRLGKGTKKDENLAFEWFKKSAEQGYVPAQSDLGICYEFELGVKKDLSEAVRWYAEAAKRGYAQAQVHLGLCYENSDGVEENSQLAVELYHKASERGNARGQLLLARCYERGYGKEKNYKKAFELYKKAAVKGDGRAQFYLAQCYEENVGVKKSIRQAKKWYYKVAEQGDWRAKEKYADLLKESKMSVRERAIKRKKDDERLAMLRKSLEARKSAVRERLQSELVDCQSIQEGKNKTSESALLQKKEIDGVDRNPNQNIKDGIATLAQYLHSVRDVDLDDETQSKLLKLVRIIIDKIHIDLTENHYESTEYYYKDVQTLFEAPIFKKMRDKNIEDFLTHKELMHNKGRELYNKIEGFVGIKSDSNNNFELDFLGPLGRLHFDTANNWSELDSKEKDFIDISHKWREETEKAKEISI